MNVEQETLAPEIKAKQAVAAPRPPVSLALTRQCTRVVARVKRALTCQRERWRLALYGAGALLAAGVLGYLLNSYFSPPKTAVAPACPSNVLHESGLVAARFQTPVLTHITGEISWRAEDGAEVAEGDPLVRFDSQSVQEELEDHELDVADKKDAVRRAEAQIKLTAERYKLVVRQAEIAVEQAKLNHDVIFAFPNPDDKLDAELTLKSEQANLAKLEFDAKTYQDLAAKGYVSVGDLKLKMRDYAVAQATFAKAKLIYDLTLEGSTPDAKRVADLAVADAEKSLHIAQFNRDADAATYQAALELAKIDLANAAREVAKRKQMIDWATVRAPKSGHVVFQDVWKGSDKSMSPVEVGETRPAGSDLCTLLDTAVLHVIVWVNEVDVGRCAEGQHAQVRLPALPGQPLDAVVTKIDVCATDKNMALSNLALRRAGEAFVNVVKVTLEFEHLPAELQNEIRVGFTADVYLNTASDVQHRDTETQRHGEKTGLMSTAPQALCVSVSLCLCAGFLAGGL